MIVSTLGLVGLGVAGLAAAPPRSGRGLRVAEPVPSSGGATGGASVAEPASRLALDGLLHFPVDLGAGDLVILNNFGGRSGVNGPCSHQGIDIGVPSYDPSRPRSDYLPGRPLLSCVDGRVFDIQPMITPTSPARGNALLIEDGLGDVYRYHHLDAFVDGLAVGDLVGRGQLVGYMGDTGNTNWPHLHFEVRRGGHTGTPVDPLPLLPGPFATVFVGPSTAC